MNLIAFSDEEKIKMFDKIADCFYNCNFGKTTKSDFELLMFNFYLSKIISTYKNSDGTIDYKKCSDYKISKDLGITQQTVRNLKIKNQLKNPIDFNWKKHLQIANKKRSQRKRCDKFTISAFFAGKLRCPSTC